MDYPQAPIKHDLYMKFPKVIETKKGNGKTHVLKLIRNLYGQKQKVCVWKRYSTEKILTIGFEQSTMNYCMLYQGRTTFACYVYNRIFSKPFNSEIYQVIKDVQEDWLDILDKGYIDYYLDMNVDHM